MITIHRDIIQGSEEWAMLRAGRVGGTSCSGLLVNGKTDSGLGASAKALAYKNAAEYATGPAESGYISPPMQRGTELEPLAIRRYEDEFFHTVERVGYISKGEYLGTSPDGLVGDDGGIEVKCPEAPEFVRFMDTLEMDKGHYAQVQWCLYITRRQWWDFVYYHPEFAPADLMAKRIFPDAEMFAKWDRNVPAYISEVSRILGKVEAEKQKRG